MAAHPDTPASQAPVAVVTGSNRGLGLELCRQLQQRGWPVVALCRRTSAELDVLAGASVTTRPCSSAATAVGGASGSHLVPAGSDSSSSSFDTLQLGRLTVVQGVDVGRDECMAALRHKLRGVPVGLLVLNAGILSVDSMAELDTSVIREQFEVNALGPLRVAHALLPNLLAAPAPLPTQTEATEAPAAMATAAATAAAAAAASDQAGAADAAAPPHSNSLHGLHCVPAGVPPARMALPCVPAGVPPAKVAVITSKMGSIQLTKSGGKNGSVGYRMSKAAANMGAQLLALELSQRGIPLVAVHPGAVATDMHAQYWKAVRSGGTAAATGGMAPSTQGPLSVQAAAAGVLARLDELGSVHSTGRFVQAATGEELPW